MQNPLTERHVPKDLTETRSTPHAAVHYTNGASGKAGKFYVMAFIGKAMKPCWYYSFRTIEQMNKEIDGFFESQAKRAEMMRERHAARNNVNAADHYKVGDLLRTSWGYDQTNVEFFKVVRVMEKSIEVVAIGSKNTIGKTHDSATCEPDPEHEIREGYEAQHNGIKRVIGYPDGTVSVRIHEHSNGYKVKENEAVSYSWGH